MTLSFKLCNFLGFKQKRIPMKTFVEPQFVVTEVYEFQTKPNFYEDICWVSVLSYESLWVSNKSEFLWRHWFSPSLKLFMFISFKPEQILTKTFVESQFQVYDFQTKANSHEDICRVSVWNYLSWRVSNKSEFLWRHLLSLGLKLSVFTSFK